jgi:hypothetical protein
MGLAGSDMAGRFVPPALDLILATSDPDLAGKSFSLLADLVHFFGADALGNHFSAVMDVLLLLFNYELPCQPEGEDFDPDLHPAVASLIKELAASLETRALTVMEPVMPALTSLVTHKSRAMRAFALEQLGQFVEAAGAELQPEFLENVLRFAIAGVREDSSAAALVLSQFASGAPAALAPQSGAVLDLLRSKLVAAPRRAHQQREFLENVVAAVAEIQRVVLRDAFPVEPFLLPCLRVMPATADRTVNKEMFLFWLWLAQRTGLQPPADFAASGIRLLAMTDDEMGEHLTQSDVPVLTPVAQSVAAALRMIADPEALVAQECGEDPYREGRVAARLAQA